MNIFSNRNMDVKTVDEPFVFNNPMPENVRESFRASHMPSSSSSSSSSLVASSKSESVGGHNNDNDNKDDELSRSSLAGFNPLRM